MYRINEQGGEAVAKEGEISPKYPLDKSAIYSSDDVTAVQTILLYVSPK